MNKLLKDFRQVFESDANTLSTAISDVLASDKIFDSLIKFTLCLFNNISKGGKVLMMGNGGSASDCAHIIGELRGRFIINRDAITAMSLSDCVATTTAIANDFGYENLFKRQLDGIVGANDSIIALSTSGTSKNITNSMIDVNIKFPLINSLFITGNMRKNDDNFKYHIQLPLERTKINVARIQEMTMFLLHSMCGMIDNMYVAVEEVIELTDNMNKNSELQLYKMHRRKNSSK